MEKFNELLSKLQTLKTIQKSIDWAENIPDEIWKEYFDGKFKVVATDLQIDEHRHYETSISVIELDGRYLGIKHISNIYSEQSSCEDCYVTVEFFEMKQVPSITYIKS